MRTKSKIDKIMSAAPRILTSNANRWRIYMHFLDLPLLALAMWSRASIGWWFLLPVALTQLWAWISPSLFPAPLSTENWASKSVLGERVWLGRKTTAIPRHHAIATMILSGISSIGFVQLVYGAVAFDPLMTFCGLAVTMLTKAWFLDRRVWLFEDMMHTSADYRDWLY